MSIERVPSIPNLEKAVQHERVEQGHELAALQLENIFNMEDAGRLAEVYEVYVRDWKNMNLVGLSDLQLAQHADVLRALEAWREMASREMDRSRNRSRSLDELPDELP